MKRKRDHEGTGSACAADQLKALADFERDDLEALAQANRELFQHLSQGQHEHKAALIAALFNGVGNRFASDLTGMKIDSIQKAKKKHEHDVFESNIFQSKARKVARPRAVDVLLKDSVQIWLKRYEKTRSGDKAPHHATFLSRMESFEDYQGGGGAAGNVRDLFRCLERYGDQEGQPLAE